MGLNEAVAKMVESYAYALRSMMVQERSKQHVNHVDVMASDLHALTQLIIDEYKRPRVSARSEDGCWSHSPSVSVSSPSTADSVSSDKTIEYKTLRGFLSGMAGWDDELAKDIADAYDDGGFPGVVQFAKKTSDDNDNDEHDYIVEMLKNVLSWVAGVDVS